MRVAIGGISHESNTFNPVHTTMDSFNIFDGRELLKDEAARFLMDAGIEVTPTIYASALPSGVVEKETYIRLKEGLLSRVEGVGKVDGVCLILHGALEVQGVGSGESDLVKGVRDVVGEDANISASLDLHGNIAPEFVRATNILTAYRTAPHRDVAETKVRAASLLLGSLKRRTKPVSVMVNPPVLLPGELVVTDIEPASSLYRDLEKIDGPLGILNASMLVGMAWADTPNSCASAIVVAEEDHAEKAYESACEIAEAYWNRREKFRYEVEVGSIDETIKMAKESLKKPVFISDSGDNVTAGAAGDIPLFVEQLLAMGVTDAVVAGILDPEAVELCKAAGVGARLRIEIGGKIDKINAYPIEVDGRVMNISKDGVAFRTGGIDIILMSRPRAFISPDSLRTYGIEPLTRKIVVVKLGYLFPELKKIAALELMALSPGYTNLMIDRLSYRRVRRPLFPLDKEFLWKPLSRG